jgi:hypothetical protein
LPPARPSISAIASEVATADGIDSTSSYNSAGKLLLVSFNHSNFSSIILYLKLTCSYV